MTWERVVTIGLFVAGAVALGIYGASEIASALAGAAAGIAVPSTKVTP